MRRLGGSLGEGRNREMEMPRYHCLLQGQGALRWNSLPKEHCQRQEFGQRATQRLTSCEQQTLVLRSEVGFPERAKEEKEGKIRYPDFSCLCSIFCPSPCSQAGSICSRCSDLEFPSPPSMPTPLLGLPLDVHWNYSCQTLERSLPCPPTHPLHITVTS